MRVWFVLSALVASVAPTFCHAQAAAAAAPDPYKNEAVVYERSETTYRMHADGSGERDVHAVLRIQSQGAAQQFGVVSFAYASAYETPTIKLVRVHKADGTTVDTPVADAIDMPAEVTREAPLYSDLKEKHLPVRSLSPGDTLEYEVDTAINKPEAPDQFWGAYHFTAPGTQIVLAEVLTVEAPADKYVQVWSPNHKPGMTEANGVRRYVWNGAQLVTAPKNTADEASKPQPPKDPDEDADGRKVPSVAWTTFHNWAEVGDWYRSLALSRAEPGDAIRAKADELTKGAKTPEDQVRALYSYVSQHNRYIGIDFGIGRYQPHGAAEVLANQYGDCKDKDTLLEALLHAKGFTTAPALIGVNVAPVPDVPSPAVFNHVITTVELAGNRVWLDSTPQAAPYRYLIAMIRDQKALVIPAAAPAALASTPAETPYPFAAHFEAVGTLDKDGKMTARVTATYHDDDEVLIRALAENVAPAEWDKASQNVSAATGFGGTTSNTQFAHGDDSTEPVVMTYDYTRHPYGDWDNHRIVPLFPVTEFSALESDSTAPQEDVQLGSPRTLNAVSRIRLPEDFLVNLPDAVHVKTDFATFDKTYKFEDHTIIAERTVVVLKKKVPKEKWKDYYQFTKDIGLVNGDPWIELVVPASSPKLPSYPIRVAGKDDRAKTDDTKTTDVKTSDKKTGATTETLTITGKAPKAEGESQLSPEDQAELAKLQRTNPNAIPEFMRKMQAKAAVAQLQEKAAAQPDEPRLAIGLAAAQQASGDSAAARQTVQQFVDRHPEAVMPAEYLAALESSDGDFGTALRTLQAAAAKNPEDRMLALNVGQALLHMNRNEDAAAAIKKVLDGATTPDVLNNAAYTLSETGLDLDVAEAASRKAVAQLEEKSAAASTEEANTRAFAEANLLIASWDTLGWILYQEGKLDAARPLIAAAWRSSLHSEVGDHLAQIEEQQGRKDEAATTYGLAQAAQDRTTPQEVRNHMATSLARLRSAGVKPGAAGSSELQELRTWHVKRPPGVGEWGAFRLEVTAGGVIEAQQMSGDAKIAGVKPALLAMKLPELLPPDSKAHLLRSAVVSCYDAPSCIIVMVPDGGLQTEAQ
jgi:transglutaminase-like putative cysteine protease/tetratricopeptide (TPR) repeat protein